MIANVKILKKYQGRYCELIILDSLSKKLISHIGQLRHISPQKISYLEISIYDEAHDIITMKLKLNQYYNSSIHSIRELTDKEFLSEIYKVSKCSNVNNFFDMLPIKKEKV